MAEYIKRRPYLAVDNTRDTMLERPLPASLEAERAILGSIILDNEVIYKCIEQGLEQYDFYNRAHQYVYKSMIELALKGSEINPILLGEQLRAEGVLEQTGGIAFISELTYGLPHFTNVARYVAVVKSKAHRRNLIKVANIITGLALEDDDEMGDQELFMESEALVIQASNEALRTSPQARKRDFVRISEDKAEFLAHLQRLHKGESAALPTGIRSLDEKLEGGGLNRQGMYLVSARPKAGKTSLALGIGYRTAKSFALAGLQQSVGIISMEMRRLALQMRLFSAHTGIAFSKMSRPHFAGTDYELALASLDSFFDVLPLYISDAVFTIPEIWQMSNRLVHGPAQARLIIIDYLQIAELRRGRKGLDSNRTAEVTAISREIKHMAQDLDVPILAISSESRAGELRESGALDYDLEALIRLVNPAWTRIQESQKDAEWKRQALAELNAEQVWDIEADLAYQRNGPPGPVPLKFLRPYMQFLTPEEYAALRKTPPQLGPASDDEALWNSTKG